MPRDYLCQAGNCQEHKAASEMWLVRQPDGSQARYCCIRHLVESLAYWAQRTQHNGMNLAPSAGAEYRNALQWMAIS